MSSTTLDTLWDKGTNKKTFMKMTISGDKIPLCEMDLLALLTKFSTY